MIEKPSWWPECPYSKTIFPSTVDDYVKAIPDPKLRTALSGAMGREFWEICSESIFRAWQLNELEKEHQSPDGT